MSESDTHTSAPAKTSAHLSLGPTLVVGDGWAAMSSVAFLASAGKQVVWVAGTGARLVAPMPTLDASNSSGVKTWQSLAQAYGLDAAEAVSGSFLREFRNKSFREMPWTKAPTPETRRDVMGEMLWEAELGLASAFECRFAITPAEIEEKVRESVLESPLVRRLEGVPVQEFGVEEGHIAFVRLANGEKLQCEQLIYADRWDALSQIEGMPKGLAFPKRRYPVGVLQAEFEHEVPMGEGIQEGFLGSLHKEAGEDAEHHVWGFFSTDGSKSTWSLCISPEEGEENHTIAKRLRRMKSALDKMFSASGWLPTEKTDYLSNVRRERVRFEESVLYTSGETPKKPIAVPGITGVNFLTDGYGPTASLSQVAMILEPLIAELVSQPGTEAHAENVDPSDAGAL